MITFKPYIKTEFPLSRKVLLLGFCVPNFSQKDSHTYSGFWDWIRIFICFIFGSFSSENRCFLMVSFLWSSSRPLFSFITTPSIFYLSFLHLPLTRTSPPKNHKRILCSALPLTIGFWLSICLITIISSLFFITTFEVNSLAPSFCSVITTLFAICIELLATSLVNSPFH